MTHYDTPIESSSQDLYSRAEMARNCAERLMRIQSDRSFVVGLAGSWGSGKTSFLNLVKENLRAESDAPIVVDFNAWLYSSQEQLVKQFFSEVKRALGDSAGEKIGSKAASEIGTAMTDYAEAVADKGADLIGAAITLAVPQLSLLKTIPGMKPAGKHALNRMLTTAGSTLKSREKTIEQQREEIVKKLSALDRNILVVIDDVDRLAKEDICALFKLVNLTASFPRMTFLLSYDMTVVTEALTGIQGIDGGAYLEKIVQLPLNLPPAPAEALRRQLIDVLGPYVSSSKVFRIDDQEHERLLEVFERLVVSQAKTPRQVKRYLNTFEAVTSAIENEICPTDAIGLAGLHVFLPHTYEWLWEHRGDVCEAQHTSLGPSDDKAQILKTSLTAELRRDGAEPESISQVLGLLFPRMACWFRSYPRFAATVPRETGRVACVQNFELFKLMSTGADASRVELHRLTHSVGESELLHGIKKLDSQRQLPRLIEFMSLNLNSISAARKELIATALFKSMGSINQLDDGDALSRTTVDQATQLAEGLLRDIGKDAADQLVLQCAHNYQTRDFVALSWFIRDESLAQEGDARKASCISQEVFERVASLYVRAIVDGYPNVVRIAGYPTQFLWRHIDEKLGGSALKEVRERYGNDAQLRVLCAGATLAHWYGSGGSGFGYSPSGHQGYDPALPMPTAEEAEGFGRSDEFAVLPEEVRVRVAALYLLLTRGAMSDGALDDEQVSYGEALALVRKWEQ